MKIQSQPRPWVEEKVSFQCNWLYRQAYIPHNNSMAELQVLFRLIGAKNLPKTDTFSAIDPCIFLFVIYWGAAFYIRLPLRFS